MCEEHVSLGPSCGAECVCGLRPGPCQRVARLPRVLWVSWAPALRHKMMSDSCLVLSLFHRHCAIRCALLTPLGVERVWLGRLGIAWPMRRTIAIVASTHLAANQARQAFRRTARSLATCVGTNARPLEVVQGLRRHVRVLPKVLPDCKCCVACAPQHCWCAHACAHNGCHVQSNGVCTCSFCRH